MWKHWTNCRTFWPIFITLVLLPIYFVYSSVSIYWTFTRFIGQCPVWLVVSTPMNILMFSVIIIIIIIILFITCSISFLSFLGSQPYQVIFISPVKPPSSSLPPLIVWPHGGPHSAYPAEFVVWWECLALLGFAIVLG